MLHALKRKSWSTMDLKFKMEIHQLLGTGTRMIKVKVDKREIEFNVNFQSLGVTEKESFFLKNLNNIYRRICIIGTNEIVNGNFSPAWI